MAASDENQTFVVLTSEKLSVDKVTEMVQANNAGAISLFIGTTRDHFEDKVVLQLEYECYEAMAKKEMNKICQKVREKWKIERIAMVHRLGVVPIGEASVIVAVSSVHRKEALEGTSFAIDSLKESVPIWKKEVYSGGHGDWKANKECSWRAK